MPSLVRRYLAHVLVVGTIAAIMLGSYASVVLAPSATPKATWTVNPLVISFSATAGSGTTPDSVTCSPAAGFVQLLAKSSNPSKLMISTVPPGLSCGSTSSAVVVTATCLVPAAQCRGSYNGQVQLRQPANYRNLPDSLNVVVNVA